MAPLFDPEIYPRVSAYVASLPDGLESHLECTCRADVPNSVRRQLPEAFDGKGMSSEARQRLLAEWSDDEWIPDVLNVTLRLMCRDRACKSDEEYLGRTLDFAGQVFQRPIYRALMHLLSPTLTLLGIEKRWGAFRRGTTIASTGRRQDGTAELTVGYPPFLYPRLMSETMGMTFRAGMTAARAKNLTVDLSAHSATESRYLLAWD